MVFRQPFNIRFIYRFASSRGCEVKLGQEALVLPLERGQIFIPGPDHQETVTGIGRVRIPVGWSARLIAEALGAAGGVGRGVADNVSATARGPR